MKYFYCLLLTFCFGTITAQETKETYAKNTDANDEKVIAFAKKLLASFYENDAQFFVDNFDIDSFASKVISEVNEENSSKSIRNFNKGFIKGFKNKFSQFPQKIITDIGKGSSYDIVNFYYHLDEQKYHVLFRLYNDEEGLNYHDYQLQYFDGDFKLQDMYVYTTGEYFSDTLRNLYELSVPTESTDTEYNRERLKTMLFMTRFQTLIGNEKYKQAFNLINNIEGEFKEKKIYYIMKIQIASAINEVYHMEAIDELLKKFPDDPSTKLMAVDYFIMLKDYNSTMKIIDDLGEATEDDFVEYIRGNAAWEFEDYETAEKSYAYIIKEYPDFENAKLSLLYMYDFLNKHEDSIVLLNSMIDSEVYTKKDLIEFIDDEESEFKNLPTATIYKRWKEKK